MRLKDWAYYMADFETTVYDGQEDTQVWASAIVPLGEEYTEKDVIIGHSISEFMRYVIHALDGNIVIYFHNLKFDGEFLISYFLNIAEFKQAYDVITDAHNIEHYIFQNDQDMKNDTFKYCISDMGQWYYIMLKEGDRFIQFRDSLKLLPFSVKRIGKGFKTKHQKLEMEYKGFRYPGCEITEEEKQYIANDVMVVQEALNIMFSQGHDRMTIGSCCLVEFKKTIDKIDYKNWFPDLYQIPLLKGHDAPTVGDWIKKSYRGGWCYIVPGKAHKIYHNGTTADVNSLYPSMMSQESGNLYPIGKPTFWTGNEIPEKALLPGRYYFVRIRTRFKIRPKYLPFIQMKGNLLYRQTESLVTSDIYNRKTGKYDRYYIDADGNKVEAVCEITMTMTDFELFKEHYIIDYLEILDGCWFYAMQPIELFETYIRKYRKIKQESKGALRELAKLFLNNLYGKMASSPNSSYKVARLREDGSLGFITELANDKQPGYIPIGTAITSYARNFTIRAAQKNYHGADKPGFIYADTDSIHCDLTPDQIKGIKIHDTDFCCWKLETQWDTGIFVRQKTYIEHVVAENLEKVEQPYYVVKCAGMPEKCKQLFLHSVNQDYDENDDFTEEELEFMKTKRTLEDFNVGLIVPSKLRPIHIKGGVLLVTTTYEMR